MKNIFFNWNKTVRNKVLLFSFFLFISHLTNAQVDPTSFTVSGTNGTCQANASVKVTIPAGNYKAEWVAYLSKGTSYSTSLPMPITGGDINFNSLAPGSYTVELKDNFTTLGTKSVTVTTSYIGLTVTNSFKVPTCTPTSTGYVANGELTVNVPTGGIGPFQFDVTYPTSSTNTTPLSQTFTGSTNTYRTHVFMNIPGGITPTITVTDLANGTAGCGQSKTQNPILPNNTSANVAYGFRAYNFVRTTDCTHPKLYINLANVTTEREAIMSVPGNATITIAGVAYNLTKISASRWTYSPGAGEPQLTNGMPITTKFYWGCSTLQRSTSVLAGDNFLGISKEIKVNNSCGMDYTMVIFGDQDSVPDGLTDRNIYFLEKNNLKFEKLVNGVWQEVPNYEITPNPGAVGTNPMGVTAPYTASIPSVSSRYSFNSPGTYRCTAWDDCHTITNTVTFDEVVPMDQITVTKANNGVLQGTSGINVRLGITLKPNFTIKISRVDGQTSMTFTATGPLNKAGSYTANFPMVKSIATPNINTTYSFSDLPLGQYKVELLCDGCPDFPSKTVTVTLPEPQAADYTPTVSPILGCTGSNKITYNLGANSYASTGTPEATLYRDNGYGQQTGAAIQMIRALSGTFINLDAGNYVIVYGNMGPGGSTSAVGNSYPFWYTQRVVVAPYGGIELETSAVICNPADTNSGIVNVELVNNAILSPTTVSLYAISNTTTPIQGPITLAASETGATFTGVPIGNYFVKATNNCTTVERNITINTSSSGTLPVAKVSRPKVCLSDNSTKLAITASSSLYDVTWTDASTNAYIGTGTPLPITPTVTTTYKATISLNSTFNCVGNTPFTSNVTVEVTPNPDLTSTVAVSDIDLCLNTNRDFTISNSQSGFTYELMDANGVSFATRVTALSTGGNLTMTIPAGIALAAGNSFKIKVSNGSAGCSGFLTDVVAITSKQNDLNLAVESPSAMICLGSASSITIKATELGVVYQLSKNGVSIPPVIGTTGTGSDMIFSIPASNLSSGTNEILITTSGSGCQNGILVNKGIILVDKAPVISATRLTPIIVNGCDNVVAPVAVTTVADLETMGVTISDDNTTDASLVVSSTDSAITGTSTTKYITRTYKITDSCNKFSTVIQNIVLNITTPTAPTISAATATTFCLGGSVVLTSSETTGNQWYKDGILISGATAQTHTASIAGTYTVVTTNSYTCSSPASAGVVVVVNALPVATINNGITLAFVDCTATTIDLTASPGSSYVWYRKLVNETAFSVLPAITQTIPASNLGFYKVKVINSTNCETESQVTQVVAKPAVSPTVLQPCVGNTVTLESNTTSFDTPTFQWKKDGIDIAGAITQNWDVTEDGEYTVEVTDGRTVGSIGTQTSCGVEVHFNPLPVVEAGTNFTITCTSNPTGLTIGETPETGFDYVWTSPKGISGLTNATIANPVANPTETTTYTVRKTNHLTLCWKEDTITITVDKTAPTANAGTPFTKTCVTNTLGKEIGIAPISGQTYSWSPATGLDNAFIANPNANPETTQTYTLTVENTTNGCTAQATVTASVDVSAPTADAGTAFTKTCVTNPTGQLIGATAVSGETYSWFPTTGLSDATSANPLANPTATTTYTVTARKTATGCTATNSVVVTVLDTPNPVALSTTIANNCPLETVDLSTIQPAAVSGIVYEWWTGTATTRVTQITNPTLYATAGTIYLWSKSVSEGCYNAVPSAVNVTMNVCCESTIGVIQETNPFYLVNYAPADIKTLEHINYATSSVVRYAIVNDLDGKIKQINTTKPEFTQLPAGNYTVHAFVFGPTVVPTGLVVGNKLAQVVPFCGTTATKTLTVQSICSSAMSYTETMTNAKQYALLDASTNQFVQVNTSGTFTMIHTGMPHQVIGFNYTGTATGIQVGGTIAGVTATNLDMTAGAIVSGCTAIITQIDGNIYNDKDKRCIEGLNNQTGLPQVTLYAKLLDSTNQVIAVSSAIQSPDYTFSMAPDLLDGVYSIVLDDNNSITDAVATYPNSWKGNAQTFTIASGQIVEYLSNTANFVPMCMQAATNKPILKPTANLVGNTYNFCKGVAATSLIIDALPGATINWYTTAVGGVPKSTPFIPTTSVVGTTTCYVSQTLNGAESDRTEVIIDVHDLPEQPTAISGSNFIAANTTQLYGVVNSSSAVTYNWILPTDWTGTSTTKDITVQVGTKEGTIGVTATSAFGCISPIQELVVRVVIEDDIEVYNSVSPNGDGDNDIFRIRNIDFYPENTLSIFNRWGIEVYRVNSYGQNDNFFKGFSDGRSTVSRDVELPEGAYFYTLTYKNTKGIERNLSGYLYIKQ
jgi:gliding motility-associated-like protein